MAKHEPVKQKPDANYCEMVRDYPMDLNIREKSSILARKKNDQTLDIEVNNFPGLSLTIRRQNIFESKAEVIVNAANTHLGGGGGIDGAIHKQGGSEYAKAHRSLKTKYQSKYTSGYASMIESGSLKEKYGIDKVIVVAGPQGTTDPQKEKELYSCYYNSLLLAESHAIKRIAFPSISTGIYGFPKDRAANISLRAIYNFLQDHPNTKIESISIHFLPSENKSNLENYYRATLPE